MVEKIFCNVVFAKGEIPALQEFSVRFFSQIARSESAQACRARIRKFHVSAARNFAWDHIDVGSAAWFTYVYLELSYICIQNNLYLRI